MSFLRQLLGLAPAQPHSPGLVVARAALAQELPPAQLGKLTYAVLRRAYLAGLVERNRDALFKSGSIIKWSPTATCTLFASSCVDLCAAEYFASAFHDKAPAPAPAIAEVWFHPDNARDGHAICAAFTEAGLIFFDPQSSTIGRQLSATERASIFHVRFL